MGQNKHLTEARGAFAAYQQEVVQTTEALKKQIVHEFQARKYVCYHDYPLRKIEINIQEILQAAPEPICRASNFVELEVPPENIKADFCMPVFKAAKELGMKPTELASEIVNLLSKAGSVFLQKISALGPFVNIEVNRELLYQETLSLFKKLGTQYGESDVHAKKTVVIDYSSPNIAKPIGVGHLRSTVIGQVLANLYHEVGYAVIRDNHLGDWGTQFGQLFFAYEQWGDKERMLRDPINELKNLYVKFNQELEKNPEIQERAREIFTRLEKGEQELLSMWKYFRDVSLQSFEQTYQRLGVKFDSNIGESYFVNQADQAVKDSLKAGAARKDPDSAAVIVDEKGNLPSFLLCKQDGSSLYLTRDLATLKFRVENFQPSTLLYVVGSEQELNFKQLFQLARDISYLDSSVAAKHVGFGMVLVDGKKMSTRRGTLITLEELLNESVAESKKILVQKNTTLSATELETVAEMIGVGAILYNDLKQSREKNISFDWEKMLNFESGSAVYLQYTYARIGSIIRKIEEEEPSFKLQDDAGIFVSKNEHEFALAKKMMLFPQLVLKAVHNDSPHIIATYLEELAKLFNSFYHHVSVINTGNDTLKRSRIALIRSCATLIQKGLALLNIGVPQRM